MSPTIWIGWNVSPTTLPPPWRATANSGHRRRHSRPVDVSRVLREQLEHWVTDLARRAVRESARRRVLLVPAPQGSLVAAIAGVLPGATSHVRTPKAQQSLFTVAGPPAHSSGAM